MQRRELNDHNMTFSGKSLNKIIALKSSIYNYCSNYISFLSPYQSGAPNDNFRKNICSEDDLRSRIFGTFAVKFLACLLLLGFSNI